MPKTTREGSCLTRRGVSALSLSPVLAASFLALCGALPQSSALAASLPASTIAAFPAVQSFSMGQPIVLMQETQTPESEPVLLESSALAYVPTQSRAVYHVDGWYNHAPAAPTPTPTQGQGTGTGSAANTSAGSVVMPEHGWWNAPPSPSVAPSPSGSTSTGQNGSTSSTVSVTGTGTAPASGASGSAGSSSTASTGSTTSSSTSSSGASHASATSGVTAQEEEMIQLMNQYRTRAGEGALTVNPTLQALALKKAHDMVTLHYFAHQSPDLGLPYQMEAAAGYVAQSMGAENIAEAGSVSEAFVMFRGSPTHWANIMDSAFTQVGVAVVPIPGGVLVEELFSGPTA